MEENPVGSGQKSTEGMDEEKRPDNDSRSRRPVEPDKRVEQLAKPPSSRQRWNAARPTKMLFFWSLVASVVLTMIIGFNWGGWTTDANAQKLANASAQAAVTQRLAPICVAQFNQDPARDAKLKELQGASSYERAGLITDQMWATMPGETEPGRQVAAACAKLLMQITP